MHASARLCGAGGCASRVRSRDACVTGKRCTAGCLGTKSGTTSRAHEMVPDHMFMIHGLCGTYVALAR
eukprot:6617877-Prymnesium_polylepis.1